MLLEGVSATLEADTAHCGVQAMLEGVSATKRASAVDAFHLMKRDFPDMS